MTRPRVTARLIRQVMRRAFRGLARLIHPDKLGRRYPQATKAFQALARAFDVLSAPEVTVYYNCNYNRTM